MAAQALYLKWRPQRFEDVVGQDHVTTTLKNALRAGRVSHAYLFSGPRGTGKTTMARLLAKAVNCLDEDVANRPCNTCRICRAINEGRLLDLIEMDAASHTGVDNVRDAIRDKVGFRPAEARYKVYVIDEVHMLSTSAFNALLKTLEEPPEHVIFCLATTEPHKVLPTIRSRCQHFEFHRIPLSALVDRLRTIAEEEELAVDEDALQFIGRTSGGCARDAISLLDQLTAYGDGRVTLERVRTVLGLSDAEAIYALLGCLAARDLGAGLDVIHDVVSGGADVRQFARQIVEHLRVVLLMHIGGDAALPDMDGQTRARLKSLVGRFTTRALLDAIKLFNQAQLDLRASDQRQLALELAYIEAALPEETAETVHQETSAPSAAPSRTPERVRDVRVRANVPPPAPPRAPPRAAPEPAEGEDATEEAAEAVRPDPVRLDEIEERWNEVRRAIRAESRQVEALVNSSLLREIEGGNCLVIRFASPLLASKLQKEENRRVVERALDEVLGRRCRVRGVVGGAAPAGASAPARLAQQAAAPTDLGAAASTEADSIEAEAGDLDPVEEAESDPVVQDLLSRGGQVTDVQVLSDE